MQDLLDAMSIQKNITTVNAPMSEKEYYLLMQNMCITKEQTQEIFTSDFNETTHLKPLI